MALTGKKLVGPLFYHDNGNHGLPCIGAHVTKIDAPISEHKMITPCLLTLCQGGLAEVDIEGGEYLWTNTTGITLRVIGVAIIYKIPATAGYFMLKVCPSETTPANGTDVLASGLQCAGNANKVYSGTLHSTVINRDVDSGESLALYTSDNIDPLRDCTISVTLIPKDLITVTE